MTIDFELIKKLEDQKKLLLEQRPDGKEIQKEIDKALDKCGNNRHNRMVTITQLMQDKKKELRKAFQDLEYEVGKLQRILKDIK